MHEINNKIDLYRILNILEFNTKNLDINRIKHVPMHQYRITTNKKDMLFVFNLQCCVGLYAYSDNFSFAAHINPVVMRRDDYILDDKGIPIKCKRMDDLREIIIKRNTFKDIVNIGISLGYTPCNEDYPTMKMIYEGIDNLIDELNQLGIKTNKLEIKNNPEFILDTYNNTFILPLSKKKISR